jgi:CRISPR-associated endonuclease/helicase Cas3
LAKKPFTPNNPRAEECLIGHTGQVLSGGRQLLTLRGAASLRATGLPLSVLPRLERIVLLATFTHDLGKASEHFQEMIRGLRTARQLVRHEALSLWLCWQAPLREWLLPAVNGDEVDLLLALSAAAGHHRKFRNGTLAPEGCGAGTSLTILTGHPDFAALLDAGQKILGLGDAPRLVDIVVRTTGRRTIEDDLDEWEMLADDQVRIGSEDARLLAGC